MNDQLQRRISNWLEHSSQQNEVKELEGSAIALGSSIGLVRKENQDRVLFLRAQIGRLANRAFVAAVLCDGVGGMSYGGQCANLAVSTFVASLIRSQEIKSKKKLEVAVQQANEAVFQRFSGTGGSTLSALLYDESDVLAVNVGDSRIYQLSKDGKVEQLSIDDTLEEQLVALNHLPQSRPSEFKQLVQYIGMGQGLEPRYIRMRPIFDIKSIILTSDGAHSAPKDVLQKIISNTKDSKEIVNRLIALSEWLGGRDNATVVAVSPNAGLRLRPSGEQDSELIELWSTGGKVEFWSSSILLQPSAEIKNAQNYLVKEKNNRSPQKRQKQELEEKDKPADKKAQKEERIRRKGTGSDKPDSIPPLNIDISNVPSIDTSELSPIDTSELSPIDISDLHQ